MRKGLFFIVLYCFSFGLIREGLALPVIEEIISGSATVSSPDQSTLVINASDQAIINYSSFDILKNETVSISLPDADSIILNRIISGSSSSIMGSLSCNGILLLINSAGLSFGPQSEIDVSSLIASTRDITNSDFLASHYIFNKNNSEYIDRLLLNQGNITISKGGFGIFIAGAVENQGIISAELGTISLVSGDKATVSFSGNDLISVAIDKAAVSDIYDHEENKVSDSIRNTGIINTEGGEILLKSEVLPELFENAINLQGIIKADTVEEHGGMISIVSSGKIQSDSVISAGTVQIKAQGDISLQKPVSAGKGGISVLSDQTVSVSSDIYSQGDVYFYSDYDADGKGDFYQSTGIIKTEQHGDISIECPGQMALNKIEAEQGSIKICTEQKPGSVLTRPEYIRSPGTISIVSTEQANTVSSIQTAEDDYLLYNTEQGVVLKADKTTIAEQGPTDLYGNIVFYNFNLIQPGKELRFEPDKSYTFLGNTIIKGSGYDVLRLVSQEKGRQWNISIPDNDYLISLAGIEDSCNTGTELLISEPSLNLGNNSGWFIDPFWVGAGADNNWSTALNWWPVAVPGAADIVTFDGTDHTAPGAVPDKDAVVDAGFSGTISSLSVDGYTGTITLNNSLIVNNALFINSGNINSNGQDFDIGSFTQTGGSFTAGASAITCSGDFSLTAGTFNADTSILTLDISSGNSLFSANGYTFNSIEFYSDSASARTVLLGSGTISFNDNFYITAAGDQNIIINASVNNPDLTIAGDLDFTGAGAGTESINMGNGTWQISGTVDFREGTVDAGHSTLIFTSANPSFFYGNNQYLYNFTVDSLKFLMLSGSNVTVTHTLDQKKTLYLDSGRTLTMADGATTNLTGSIMGPGTLELVDSAGANLSLGGDLTTKIKFIANTTDITVPARTFLGSVEIYNNGAGSYSATLGTAAAQTIDLGSLILCADGAGNLTVDAATHNPAINISGNLDFTGTGEGTESISLGTGAWTVGGDFNLNGGTITAENSTLVLDASSWEALGTGVNDTMDCLVIYDGKLIAGGYFTTAGGAPANRIASWDGGSWSSLGSGMNGTVESLTVYGGKLIAGGYFTTAGGTAANYIASWDGGSWSSLGSGMNGTVESLTVYGGDLIAGGWFTTAGGAPANRIASWDGGSWSALGSGMNGTVKSLTVYGGDLIAGGYFTTAGGTAANYIASWDGTDWSALGAGVSDHVLALIEYDGNLIAGGWFIAAGISSANFIAQWDGASWSTIDKGTNSSVNALEVYNNNLTVGGDYSCINGHSTNYIALKKDNPSFTLTTNNQTFNDITIQNDSSHDREIIISDTLTLNGNLYLSASDAGDITLNAATSNPDLTIAGDLDFTGAGAGTESINMGNGTWQISGTVDFREGTVDAGHSLLYKTGTYETIYGDGQTLWDLWLTTTTELADSDLYIDNSLTVNGYLFIDSSVTLRLNDNAFSSFTANANVMNPGMIEFVDSACSNITLTGLIKTKTRFTASAEDINIPPLTLYGPVEFYNAGAEDRTVTLGTAAGQNLTLGSVFINAADDGDLALDAAAWNPDITVYGDLDFTGTGSGTEFLSLGNGAWTVGGNIDFTDGILNPGTSPVYMNASSWDNLGLGTGYHPYVICVYDGKLIAGGEFTEAGGNSINKIAAWDGTEWSSLGPGLGHYVYDLTVYNGNLIAGGYFNNDIAAWDGTEWSSLGSGISGGAVYSLTVYNGNLIAAGGFTTAGGAPANRIAQWDGANWSSLGSGMNAPVSSLYVYDGKLFAGGNFTTAGGVAANCIAAWDGANWSSPGSGMSGGSTAVLAMTVYDNKLITGGNFNSAGGVAANCIAAWDGANWFSLGSGVSHLVKSMLIDNGKLIAAGTFSKAGGQIVNYIASWDGTDWSALGSGFDREVYDICSYNGGIAAVGRFTNAGIEAEHVAVMDNTALLTCGNQTLNQLVITNNTDFDRTVTLSGNLSLNSDLMIDCQKTGAITLDAAAYSPDLNISGNFGFTGAGSGSETFNMGSGTWTVAGDADLRNGTFICNASSFILNGSDQTVYGSNTFFNFSKAGSNGTLYFEQGSTQNITGSLVLQGSDLLYLRSTAEGIQWNIDPQATVTASFLDVKDSCNLNALEISASDSVDSLNNTNWVFLSSVQDDPDPAIDDNVLAQEMPDPENITYNSQLPDLASEPPDDNIALSDDPGSSPVNTENSDLSSGPGTTDTADPASDPVTADCAEKRTNDGFDYSQLWEDRGKKKKKNYRKAKYTTTVILYEGKVIMDPYSEKGQDKAQRRILFPGEKTAQSCTVK